MYLILQQIVQYFWEICLLRRGPEGLPVAPGFVALIAAVYLPVSAFSWVLLLPLTPGEVLVAQAVDLGVVTGFLALLMYIKQVPPSRGLQTFAAVLGTGTIMSLLLMPFLLLAGSEAAPVLMLVSVTSAVYLWWLAVAGFILHRGCNVSHVQGSMFFLAIMLTSLLLVTQLFSHAFEETIEDPVYSSNIE